MECIEIALAADGGYFCGLLETSCSMAMHADKSCRLNFHVLDAGISEGDKKFVTSKISEFHPCCHFEWIPVDQKMFEGLPKWNGGYMVYTRLLLPQLLKGIDWVIYCDCDFTWMRDVAELWRERDDDFVLLSTKDGAHDTLKTEGAWLTEHGFPFDPEKYFCAGLTFFNLKRFREEGLDKRCLELLQMHPPFNDQTVLNIVGFGRTKLVPQIWQRFTEVVTQEEIDNGVVIHHAGEIPWKKMKGISMLSDTMLIWHRMNAKIRGITLWESLRMWFSKQELIAHRLPVYPLRWLVVKVPLKWSLRIVGHPGVWNMLEIRSRRIYICSQKNTLTVP